jgi:hypothetical protein
MQRLPSLLLLLSSATLMFDGFGNGSPDQHRRLARLGRHFFTHGHVLPEGRKMFAYSY